MKEVVRFPKGIRPKGKIKIELFCCYSGDKLHEVLDNNFISKGLDYAYYYVMLSLYTRNKATGANEIKINNPFYQMRLTNNDKPEKPKEDWALEGSTIGHALTTSAYSGDSTTQGSYNMSESFTNAEQVHIVVDFPTHAANGTFESIYFYPEGGSLIQTDNRFMLNKIAEETNIISLQKYNGMYYVLGGYGSSVSMYVFNEGFSLTNTLTLKSRISDFHIRNGIIYYPLHGTTSTRGIYMCPLSNTENETRIVSGFSYPSGESVAGIIFDTLTDRWIISSSGSSSDGSSSSSIYDDDFELIEVVTQGRIQSPDYLKLFYDIKTDTIVNTYGMPFNRDTRRFDGTGSGTIYGFIDGDHAITSTGHVIPKYRISSRCKLGAPVTKTENTNMKVTYDFALPKMWSI